jgi:hypothetical protein
MGDNQQNSCLRRAHDLANDADRHVIVIEHTQAMRSPTRTGCGKRWRIRSAEILLPQQQPGPDVGRGRSVPLGCAQPQGGSPDPKTMLSSIRAIISFFSPELHSNDTCMCCRPACATVRGLGTLPD